jgi:hypothetical protein
MSITTQTELDRSKSSRPHPPDLPFEPIFGLRSGPSLQSSHAAGKVIAAPSFQQIRALTRSYPAAMKEIGNADRRDVGRRFKNPAEDSHQPFRRRKRAMQLFRSAKTLLKFSSIHAQVPNHFNQERHLVAREV